MAHIYAFGSVCRGEVDIGSDIDLLAIVDGDDDRFDPSQYSIYTLKRLKEIWNEGNPFAWHLALEAKELYSSNNVNVLKELGMPSIYRNVKHDCEKFYNIFVDSVVSLNENDNSETFDLSTIFLAIRNIATCYSVPMNKAPDFSRNSAKRLQNMSIPISNESYKIFERSRILCTRGLGDALNKTEILIAKNEINTIDSWMKTLLDSIGAYKNDGI